MYLHKFHDCRMMLLCFSRKLEMYQAIRTILILKFHTFLILSIIPRKTSYSSKNICHKFIFKNGYWINLRLKFQKSPSFHPTNSWKFERYDANQAFFWVPPGGILYGKYPCLRWVVVRTAAIADAEDYSSNSNQASAYR